MGMKALIPDEKTLSPDHPIHHRDELVYVRGAINADRHAWAQSRYDKAQESLDGRVGGPGPIAPRAVTRPGNISMYDHLQSIKTRMVENPEGEADAEVARIEDRIESITQSMKPDVRWQ